MESFYNVPNGCKHHGDCFSCPYDDCINGEAANLKRQMQHMAMEKAQRLFMRGRGTQDVADQLQVSRRTAQRYRRAMTLC